MPSARHILLLADDPVVRASLAEQLRQDPSFLVSEAARLADLGETVSPADLVLVDQASPDDVGLLRAQGFQGPVLVLGGDITDKADERIEKPFRFSHVLARLHAYLAGATDNERSIQIGPYQFRHTAKLLIDAGGERIRLTEKEANILKFLHGAGGTVARDRLLHEVWGYNPAVTTHTLETHIYRLRRKIEKGPGEAKILLTDGGGYRLA
jgi:DNA-binding response OmpR family regulator